MSQTYSLGGPLSVLPLHQSLQKEESLLKVDASLLPYLSNTYYVQASCWGGAIAVSRQTFIHLEIVVTFASLFLPNYHCVGITRHCIKLTYAHVYNHRT